MKSLPLSLLAFLLIVASCANPNKPGDTDQTPVDTTAVESMYADTLTDVYWKLKSLNAKSVSDYPAQNKEPYITFRADNRVEGTGGCNGMGGSYALGDNNKITFSQIISTKMACPDMTLETDFHGFLMGEVMYAIANNELTLTRADTTTAVFEKSMPR